MVGWIVPALLSAIFAALVAVLAKFGLQGIDSTLATTVRSVVMAIFLLMTSLLLGKGSLLSTLNGKSLTFIVLSGIAGALSWLAYFFALRTGPASAIAALDRLSVVFVLVFSVLFLAEQLTWKSGLGALLITAGAILMTVR
jgi:bacterial/archaeal transporter family protein